jgi:outer membrane lipoprotein-sorting protein
MLSAKAHKIARRRGAEDSDDMTRLASRRLRWLLPAGIAAAIAVASFATSAAASGSAQPKLGAKTAAQLLVAVEHADPAGLSGTIVETAKLGLPDISGLAGEAGASGSVTSLESLVTGSTTMNVWYAGTQRQRFALLGQLSENDVIHNGTDLWSYESSSRTVTHETLPVATLHVHVSIGDNAPALDPQTAAEKALAAIDPTTTVVVDRTARVAGRAAYQLLLTPKDTRSLIGSVRIAVDSATSVPLRVQIFAADATSPAFEVGFTSVSFNVPSASVFDFVPPAGATVEENTGPFEDSTTTGPVLHTQVRVSGSGGPQRTVVTPGSPAPTDASTARITTELGKGWTEVVKITNAMPGFNSPPPNAPAGATVRRDGPLAEAGTPVAGGELITTTLVSVLITDSGTVYIGPVSGADIQKVASTGQGL